MGLQPLWKIAWQFLKKLDIPTIQPSHLTPRHLTGEMHSSTEGSVCERSQHPYL